MVLPLSERVLWLPASRWQEYPAERGQVTNAEGEVTQAGRRKVEGRGRGPAGVTVPLAASPW